MKKLGRPDLVAHADYVIVVDTDACVQCSVVRVRNGVSLARRAGNRERWCFIRISAMDAGLCVSTCASNVIRMVLRAGR